MSEMKQARECECTTEFGNWYMMWEHPPVFLGFTLSLQSIAVT